jgi:type III secretory pathway component EscU
MAWGSFLFGVGSSCRINSDFYSWVKFVLGVVMIKWIIFGIIFVSYYAWDYYSERKQAKNGVKKKAKDIVSGPDQWKVAQLE